MVKSQYVKLCENGKSEIPIEYRRIRTDSFCTRLRAKWYRSSSFKTLNILYLYFIIASFEYTTFRCLHDVIVK